jgi:hypothetical protein
MTRTLSRCSSGTAEPRAGGSASEAEVERLRSMLATRGCRTQGKPCSAMPCNAGPLAASGDWQRQQARRRLRQAPAPLTGEDQPGREWHAGARAPADGVPQRYAGAVHRQGEQQQEEGHQHAAQCVVPKGGSLHLWRRRKGAPADHHQLRGERRRRSVGPERAAEGGGRPSSAAGPKGAGGRPGGAPLGSQRETPTSSSLLPPCTACCRPLAEPSILRPWLAGAGCPAAESAGGESSRARDTKADSSVVRGG